MENVENPMVIDSLWGERRKPDFVCPICGQPMWRNKEDEWHGECNSDLHPVDGLCSDCYWSERRDEEAILFYNDMEDERQKDDVEDNVTEQVLEYYGSNGLIKLMLETGDEYLIEKVRQWVVNAVEDEASQAYRDWREENVSFFKSRRGRSKSSTGN